MLGQNASYNCRCVFFSLAEALRTTMSRAVASSQRTTYTERKLALIWSLNYHPLSPSLSRYSSFQKNSSINILSFQCIWWNGRLSEGRIYRQMMETQYLKEGHWKKCILLHPDCRRDLRKNSISRVEFEIWMKYAFFHLSFPRSLPIFISFVELFFIAVSLHQWRHN